MLRRHSKKLVIVALMISAGIALEFAGLLDAEEMLGIAREYSDQWWLVLVLILLQTLLFTFALAGSFFLWIVAPLYPPAMATFILAAGGTLGGICAYLFSNRLTDDWISRIENSQTYKLLHKQDNFFVLFALRVFPAFPHSLVNYSSGILKVKLSHFILAAIAGLSIKSYIYSVVIYNAAASASIDDLLDISTYGPLILLSLISLAGVFIKYRLTARDD
ncbi:MAG: VTT domain-containing protein [Gammaproteobacteria bacterium]|nr:VTT domain-containing protein [Gammaproteobacteria bacterium]NNJ49026.1 VTT domain-containing protein [Gammaproteobacteria bacterium]